MFQYIGWLGGHITLLLKRWELTSIATSTSNMADVNIYEPYSLMAT